MGETSEINYTPTNWKDHIIEKPRTYKMIPNNDGTITLQPEPGTVEQQGTPLSAKNLNHMEQGIVAVSMLAAATAEVQKAIQDELKEKDGSYSVSMQFLAADWIQSESGRYTQTVAMNDFTINTRCRSIDIDMSTATEDNIEDIREAWSLIDNAETVEGGVMLTAFDDVPGVDFGVIIEVVK